MVDFILIVAATVLVAGVAFGVAAFVLDHTPGVTETMPDGVSRPLPNEGAVTGADVRALRFDMALRGYHMAQVDAVLCRLGVELDDAHTRISQLERELATIPGHNPSR